MSGGPVARAARLVRVVIAIAAAALFAPGAAAAAKPLGITGFSVQTTQAKPVPYGAGIPGYGFVNEAYDFTQAGGHPEGLTSTLEFTSEEVGPSHELAPTQDPKQIAIELPAGLSGNPRAAPQCPRAQAAELGGSCPSDTQVGVFVLRSGGGRANLGPIVNVEPEAGQAVELGLQTPELIIPLSVRLARSAEGYALEVVGSGLPVEGTVNVEMTLWSAPAQAGHDPERGLECSTANVEEQWHCEGGGEPPGVAAAPFLSMPRDCSTGPEQASVWADSWEQPGSWAQASATLPGATGCAQLAFEPEIALEADTPLADAPLGLALDIGTPQSESAQAPATPPLRQARVTLPQGVSISPAGAAGLRACAASGPEGFGMPTGLNAAGAPLDPAEIGVGEEAGPSGEARLAPGHCSQASTLGSLLASTPLSAQRLRGFVYLASPRCGGPAQEACGEADALDGELYRVYVELGGAAEESGHAGEPPAHGVIVKLEGELQANPASGQLTLELPEAPQLPLSALTLELHGGPRALLDNPAVCAVATTSSELTPWSATGETPEGLLKRGTPDATGSSHYEVSGCGEPPALDPGFLAESASAKAGAYTPFALTVTRGDREQYLAQIQVRTPPGLLAMLASVPLCEAALAAAGACPAAARIGATTVAAGAGSAPLEIPGSVYLTGPYEGAPFGLAIVTPALVGPFDLGTIAIRARVEIDPQSGALTITSDRLPQIVLGVPLRLRAITLDLDRPDFVFNPTDCDAQQVMATVTGAQGASAAVSSSFALGACRALVFKPILTARAQGKPGSSTGASLEVKLTFPASTPGSEANLARVRLALPRQLASRLTTLQLACEDTVFEADPAACPKASIVGVARARTPVLATTLAGPIYFVSHGGAAFPSLVVVLQGEGVQSELSAATEIDAQKITSVTFARLPDVPVSSFEATLPAGPHSALGAGASLCPPAHIVLVKRSVTRRIHGRRVHRTVVVRKRVPTSLVLGTELVAQNGAAIHRDTRLEVSGCTTRAAKTDRQARIPKFKVPTFL